MGMAAELATSLLEPPLAEQASRAALSQSNLTLFRYSPSLGAAGEVALHTTQKPGDTMRAKTTGLFQTDGKTAYTTAKATFVAT